MKDKLVTATACNGHVRIIGAATTDLVNEAMKIHNASPTGAAALGRMLTAGALMGSMMKNKQDKISLRIDGNGPAKGIVVTGYSDASVKGYMGNPTADLPLNESGKLDVSGVIGKNGELMVIRDMGLKESYVGRVPIYTGEIAEDIAYYYTVSEQTPSAVALGVLVGTDLSIIAAGGFIIQMLPDADHLAADLITYRLEEVPAVTTMMTEGKSIKEIISYIFEDMDLKFLDEKIPMYKCDCSREKVEKALISLGEKELINIINDNKAENIRCEFCGKEYNFLPEEWKSLIQK